MKIIPYYRFRRKPNTRSRATVPPEQRQAVNDYAQSARAKVGEEFLEVEEGKMIQRPTLDEAIAMAQKSKARLVIADPYRASQDLALLQALRDGQVDFVVLGNTTVTPKTVGLLAETEAEERRQIQATTKQILAERKEAGVKLGSARPGHWKGREHLRGWKKGAENSGKKRSQNTYAVYAPVILPKIEAMRKDGKSDEFIANKLNEDGHRTTAGKPFTFVAVYRLRERYLTPKKSA